MIIHIYIYIIYINISRINISRIARRASLVLGTIQYSRQVNYSPHIYLLDCAPPMLAAPRRKTTIVIRSITVGGLSRSITLSFFIPSNSDRLAALPTFAAAQEKL